MLTSPLENALDPLDEGLEDQRVIAQIACLDELDLRDGAPRPASVCVVDPPHQHAGEQEIRKDHDTAKAEADRALERAVDARLGDAAEADLGPAEAHALPEHAGDLGDVAVGIRVGGAAADDREQRLLARHVAAGPGERRLDPVARRAQELGVDAEIAAEADPQPVLGGVAVQHRGYVVLDVAGGEQHARHGEHLVDAARAAAGPGPRAGPAGRTRESRSRAASAAGGRQGRATRPWNSSTALTSREPWPQTMTPILLIDSAPVVEPRLDTSPACAEQARHAGETWGRAPAPEPRMILAEPASMLAGLLLALLLDALIGDPHGSIGGCRIRGADRPGGRPARGALAGPGRERPRRCAGAARSRRWR